MLDFRHETFKNLCALKNYAKTAEKLHITQPAVSQHIKFLEGQYGTLLIAEKGKRFSLTPAGKELLLFIQSCDNGLSALEKRMNKKDDHTQELVVGATKSVGEYIMPNLIAKILQSDANINFNLIVDNTASLLEKLENGHIDFAFIEGYFDASSYEYLHFSNEEFIGVCSPHLEFSNGNNTFANLLSERQIIREKGSGSREIYEEILHENHLNLSQFAKIMEVNNLTAIKKLVAENVGISFLYKFSVIRELNSGELKKIEIDSFNAFRKLHFVYPKNNLTFIYYNYWFSLFSKLHLNL